MITSFGWVKQVFLSLLPSTNSKQETKFFSTECRNQVCIMKRSWLNEAKHNFNKYMQNKFLCCANVSRAFEILAKDMNNNFMDSYFLPLTTDGELIIN